MKTTALLMIGLIVLVIMMNRIEFFKSKIPLWREDLVLFSKEVLLFTPDKWQEDVFKDIVKYNRVSVKSGQGVGKTGCEAIILLWFLCCFPFPRIVATAPTKQQLHDVLWSEVSKWQSKSPLLCDILKWTKTYIYMKGYEKRWFAVARTATKAENMQGFHEDNMLFIVDEASGVSDPIMEAILGTLSGENNKLFMCGNPTKTNGVFYDSHTKDREHYKCHTVNSLNSPRTNKENINALIKKFGEDSNVVKVRVYGEFPVQEDDVFIPLSLLENSIYTEPKNKKPTLIHIGCDVARFGDDKTVIAYRVDEKCVIHKKIQGQDLMKTASDILHLAKSLVDKYQFKGQVAIKIDDGGVGGGVIDRLKQMIENDSKLDFMKIISVAFGRQIKHKYYYDTTTFMMHCLKTLLSDQDEDGNKKDVEIILPNDDDLIGQLSSRKYKMTDRGKIKVESKKEMKSRGLKSPDEGDCILLLALPVSEKR